eukprot:Anaeramoba_ignava/a219715_3.p1 GENE.a219715_3~~a219715_3.p1  ORF type:complete len:145 (-),score=29.32 a219715_3:16-450(-)
MGYKIKIYGDLNTLEKTWDLIHFLSIQHGMPEQDADVFAVAVGEAYGNGLQYSQEHESELIMNFYEDKIVAEVINAGEEIDFKNIDAFDTEQDFMQYKDGHLGIPMMKTLVDEVSYSHADGKNKLELLKKINLNVVKGENNENY